MEQHPSQGNFQSVIYWVHLLKIYFLKDWSFAPWAFKKISDDDQKICSRKLYFGTQRRGDAKINFEHGKHRTNEIFVFSIVSCSEK